MLKSYRLKVEKKINIRPQFSISTSPCSNFVPLVLKKMSSSSWLFSKLYKKRFILSFFHFPAFIYLCEINLSQNFLTTSFLPPPSSRTFSSPFFFIPWGLEEWFLNCVILGRLQVLFLSLGKPFKGFSQIGGISSWVSRKREEVLSFV